jgi:hypothetical protein
MPLPQLTRRDVLLSSGAAGIAGAMPYRLAAAQLSRTGPVVSVADFGARTGARDNTRAIQAAIDEVQRRGGGTVIVPGQYHCGNIVISGRDVRIQGQEGWLINGRLTVGPSAEGLQVADLGVLHTRGDPADYPAEISGRNCSFDNLQLVKDPIAGGYQMYVRPESSGCRFTGLRLKGSNGIFLAGRDHLFEGFELESTMSDKIGGDDAFAIKALGSPSENITIRNGVVRGFTAIVSFGSEIGTPERDSNYVGAVRNVLVENVTADPCSLVAFFKPGALIYDWRNGLVEHIRLRNLSLNDTSGKRFGAGIRMIAARGAIIRDVVATGIQIHARALNRGVSSTAAVDLTLLEQGAPARIEDVRLQVSFVDPYAGGKHGPGVPGYPIEHVVRIEKANPAKGSMSGIVLDVEGEGSGFGGIYVGSGLDGAVTVERAILKRVATSPPASVGGGGIWSDSRLTLGNVQIDSIMLPKFGGSAFATRR